MPDASAAADVMIFIAREVRALVQPASPQKTQVDDQWHTGTLINIEKRSLVQSNDTASLTIVGSIVPMRLFPDCHFWDRIDVIAHLY